ncbi:MAG TPA: GntR family transcriptional regulator [Sphingomicrobium sp.]|nr:GntR family transcriptional regulator [Sphingomicrobium sp.]
MAVAINQNTATLQSIGSLHCCSFLFTVYNMQSTAHTLDRQNISDQVANAIREMIVDGALPAGSRINEVHLARDLGVSRTPLREAIAGLVRESTLVAVPRVGAFVKPLSLEEFDQISIREILDPEALRLSGLPSHEQIDRLERLNARMRAARDPDTVIALDDEWHLLLVENCPNKVLLGLIQDFMRRTRRYELALMRERQQVEVATDTHAEIIDALRRADLKTAAKILKRNLQTGREPIRRWLIERE